MKARFPRRRPLGRVAPRPGRLLGRVAALHERPRAVAPRHGRPRAVAAFHVTPGIRGRQTEKRRLDQRRLDRNRLSMETRGGERDSI